MSFQMFYFSRRFSYSIKPQMLTGFLFRYLEEEKKESEVGFERVYPSERMLTIIITCTCDSVILECIRIIRFMNQKCS